MLTVEYDENNPIIFPPGTYTINSPIIVPDGMTVMGVDTARPGDHVGIAVGQPGRLVVAAMALATAGHRTISTMDMGHGDHVGPYAHTLTIPMDPRPYGTKRANGMRPPSNKPSKSRAAAKRARNARKITKAKG